MKYQLKNLLIIGIFLFQNQIFGQVEWAPVGAKWYYTAPYNGKCIYMESVADTTIMDKDCKIVELRYCADERLFAREFLYQTGDSLLYYNYYHESFHTLYDFSADVGDTVKIHDSKFKRTKGFYYPYEYETDSVDHFIYTIVSIDSINVSNVWLKRQRVVVENNDFWTFSLNYENFLLVEKFGSITFFFGRNSFIKLDESSIASLRCYKDELIDYANPEWNKPCNSSITSTIDQKKPFSPDVFPNPFKNEIVIKINDEKINVELFSMYGKLILSQEVNQIGRINTSELKNGFYIIKVKSKKNDAIFKMIKQ